MEKVKTGREINQGVKRNYIEKMNGVGEGRETTTKNISFSKSGTEGGE